MDTEFERLGTKESKLCTTIRWIMPPRKNEYILQSVPEHGDEIYSLEMFEFRTMYFSET